MNNYWDYHCQKCGQTGSAPIPQGESVLNCAGHVIKAHAEFNPDCDRKYQGRWIVIRHVGVFDGKCMYGHSLFG